MTIMGNGRRYRLRTRSRSLFELDRRLEGDEIVLEHHMRRTNARLNRTEATLARVAKLLDDTSMDNERTLLELREHEARPDHS